ncbi:peptidase S1 and S6, chymotrypsin/Hap [Rivularia sp. IAM M-261]|nr:peptidase S1 and S6, chymotrypsin/Hap [Rivularia sp. IAM M-261]
MSNYRQAFKSAIARVYSSSGAVVGAGFLVSNRHLLTCAHVVTAALGISLATAEAPSDLVDLDFPLILPEQKVKAKVVFWGSPQGNNDIAALELEQPSNGYGAVKLVSNDNFWNHPFQIFGFPSQRDFGVWASGVLRDKTAQGWVQMEDIKTQGYQVQPGFSGAPIWDENLEGVVGMAVAAEKKREEVKAAFMIPTSMLASAWQDLTESIVSHQVQSVDSLDSLPSFRQVKIKALKNNLKVLIAKYEAAYNQLNFTLSQADAVSIREQIKILEGDIIQREEEIKSMI